MSTMFDTLLRLPLFQGLSQEDFTNILGKVKLHFVKYKPGEVIAQANEPCDKLIFLLKGEIYAETTPDSKLFTYIETFTEPYLTEPESLFGMYPHFKASYVAKTEVSIMTIDKVFILRELLKYNVFRLNYVNNLSNRAQAVYNRLWENTVSGTRNKITHFFLNHAEKREGEKTIVIKMDDLAEIIDDTRLNVSRVLNEMQEDGLVQLKRKIIYIPELSKLTS